jgi:glycosyltransferase involved in cell wall biosynthesis
MRLLFVVSKLRDGGAQAQACDLASGLIEMGVSCRIAALHPSPGHADHQCVDAVILSRSIGDRALLGALRSLFALCRRERPDLVHSHGEKADFAARIVCWLLGIPHVVTIHTPRPWHWRRRLGIFLERRMAFLTRKYIAVSSAVAGMLSQEVGVPPERICVIENWAPESAVATGLEALPHRGQPTIINVARLDVAKGQEILLRGFDRVRLHYPNAVLWMVGAGPEEAALRRSAGPGVEFLGDRWDVARLLGMADLFVLSSWWEGMPLSILEAMREGTPVVASHVGGIPELVEHGVTGTLFSQVDPSACAAAMLACLADPARAHAMALEAQRRCTGRRERGLALYVACYEDTLQVSQRPPMAASTKPP